MSPATWHWFGLRGVVPRALSAFSDVWRSFSGPIKKEGEAVTIDVFAFMTVWPNKLVANVHPSRMPVMLASPQRLMSGSMARRTRPSNSLGAIRRTSWKLFWPAVIGKTSASPVVAMKYGYRNKN